MGTQRASNKDILDAIQALTAAITAQVVAPAPVTQPVAEAPAVGQFTTDTVKVDAAYKQHMMAKIQPFADKHGEDVVLYARRNNRGETKLAYAVKSKFSVLKDRGLLGAVAIVNPS
jgi:hypothetical protein